MNERSIMRNVMRYIQCYVNYSASQNQTKHPIVKKVITTTKYEANINVMGILLAQINHETHQ